MERTTVKTVNGEVEVVADGGKVKLFVDEFAELDQNDVRELVRALEMASLVAVEQQARIDSHQGWCHASMTHADGAVSPCLLPKRHLLDDSDHEDSHGHRAPVLVHQSTIREAERIQAARDAGQFTD